MHEGYAIKGRKKILPQASLTVKLLLAIKGIEFSKSPMEGTVMPLINTKNSMQMKLHVCIWNTTVK